MVALRKLRKSIRPPVYMAKTGMFFEGSELVLSLANPVLPEGMAGRFQRYLARARQTNVADILMVSLAVQKRIMSGKPLWREK